MDWISVKDEKEPIPNKWYLVWQENGLNAGEDFLVWDDGQWIWPTRGTYLVRENITHWLDIEPPKDE